MKSKLSWITLVIAVIALLVAAAKAREPQRRQVWEYRVTLSNVNSPAELDPAGNEGWEFVQAVPSNNGAQAYLYFKRPR